MKPILKQQILRLFGLSVNFVFMNRQGQVTLTLLCSFCYNGMSQMLFWSIFGKQHKGGGTFCGSTSLNAFFFFFFSLKNVHKYFHECRMCVKIQGVIFKVARIFRVFFLSPFNWFCCHSVSNRNVWSPQYTPHGKALRESTN